MFFWSRIKKIRQCLGSIVLKNANTWTIQITSTGFRWISHFMLKALIKMKNKNANISSRSIKSDLSFLKDVLQQFGPL